MNKKEIVDIAVNLIDEIMRNKCSILSFIRQHNEFIDIPVRSLMLPEYLESGLVSESVYIYLIGSYIYYNISGESVTWLQRRRFAEFSFSDDLNGLFRRSLCSSPKRRFTSLQELKLALNKLL